MGYVIMTLSNARISERRTGIIYIYGCISLHIPLFFLFRLLNKAAILTHNPSLFFLFLFLYRKNSTARTIHQINQAVAPVLLCVPHRLYIPPLSSQPITLWFSSSFSTSSS
ncbi:Mmo1p SPAR_K01670 [Saccharomyces paradoxus]|uniref:Mmo1p n=1 Tax=Saccharomyces paradoxus TaxID=27291 RepID=A0A8B8UUY4_SACPA|nr:uncharacterized protein SPAR_K01670 [Saccharomyces paradoxus]QHS74550.1 hypothetical protein SPAR_K01670 [Saccharomyces paradoxus]